MNRNLNAQRRNIKIVMIVITTLFLSVSKINAQTTVISNPYLNTISISNTQSPIVQSLNCVDLSYDLFKGLSDKSNDKAVTNLQNYLNKLGYLKAAPNGYFGPATMQAVKNYQTANNILSTGRVGPATRKNIRDKSCNVGNTASIINSVITPSPSPKMERVNSANQTVYYPQASSSIATDTKISIKWAATTGVVYGLILEDKDGVGVGHIIATVIGDRYDWTVGKVFSSRENSDIYVEPGIYRVRVSGTKGTNSVGEQYSGLFTIKGKNLAIESINPNFIYSKIDNYIAAIGKGYDNTTQINLDMEGIIRKIKPNFVSDDGKMIVFRVPSYISQGQYMVSVFNTYASGATSTPSNAVNLTIKE